MTMWEDYSFASASGRDISDCDSSLVNLSSSSASFRRAWPFSDDDHSTSSSDITGSIAELSRHFQVHSLHSRHRFISTTSQPPPLQNLPLIPRREGFVTTNPYDQRRRLRQTLIRRQCSPANLSRLSALVQNVNRSHNDTYVVATPKDRGCIPPLQVHQINPSSLDHISPTLTSSGSSEDYELESQIFTASRPRYKVGKSLTHDLSKKGLARQRLVHKDVRLRTKRRSTTPGG